jgi:uncharacterized protein YciI
MQTLLLFLAAFFLVAQNPFPPPGMNCPQRTLVTFEEGPSSDKAQQLFQQHISYLSGQMKAGKVISAGPLAAGHTALILFATKDWDEIQEILKNEPFTQAGVIKVVRHDVWNACEVAK